MPPARRKTAGERFEMARCVHFGFEGDAGGVICKLYLERLVPDEEARQARERAQPVLLHLAFKWNPASEEHVTTEYLWHPALTAAEIGGRLAQHVYREGAQESLPIANAGPPLPAGES